MTEIQARKKDTPTCVTLFIVLNSACFKPNLGICRRMKYFKTVFY